MKYYYAVVTCDTHDTAESLYKECDGMELEHSGQKLDLRMIPDELKSFPHKARDTCTQLPEGKKEIEFLSWAKNHTYVNLTWEANDQKRFKFLTRHVTKD